MKIWTDDLVFGAFEVAISGTRLDGRARGEPIDVTRHRPAVEVKGATLTRWGSPSSRVAAGVRSASFDV